MAEETREMLLCFCFSLLKPHGVLNTEEYNVQWTLCISIVVCSNFKLQIKIMLIQKGITVSERDTFSSSEWL